MRLHSYHTTKLVALVEYGAIRASLSLQQSTSHRVSEGMSLLILVLNSPTKESSKLYGFGRKPFTIVALPYVVHHGYERVIRHFRRCISFSQGWQLQGHHCAFSIVPCFMSVSSFVQIGIAEPQVLLPLARIGRDGMLDLHCTWQSTARVVCVHFRILPQMNMMPTKHPTW